MKKTYKKYYNKSTDENNHFSLARSLLARPQGETLRKTLRVVLTTVKAAFAKRKILMFSLLFLIVALPIFIIAVRYQRQTEAAWYNDSWLYRTAITISNSGAADANKKTKFDIDTAALYSTGKIQVDCDDSRFTDINGKLLKYYLDSVNGACNTNSTDYWVLLPNIPAGTFVMYHYYGNPSASKGSVAAQFSQDTFTPGSTSSGSEEQSKGPVAYWKFDEGYGGTAHDSTTNANNGTLGTGSSAPTWQTEDMCISGKCLKFDGSNDYVETSDSNSLDLTSQFTISAWFKSNNISSAQSITGKWNGGAGNGRSYRLAIANSKVYFAISSNGNNSYTHTGNTTLSSNTWYYITAVYKGSTQTMDIYVNGVLDANTYTSAPATIYSTNSALCTGAVDNSTDNDNVCESLIQYLSGFIDDVKIYPYARSAAEIKSDYLSKGGAGSKGTSVQMGKSSQNSDALSNGLVGYWKMDESIWSGTANEVVDSSGNGKHGTAQGSTNVSGAKFGNGGSFDGTDTKYISIGTTADYDFGTSDFAVSTWVKRTASAGWDNQVVTKWNTGASPGTNEWGLVTGWDSATSLKPGFAIESGNTTYTASSADNMNNGEWHHLIGIRKSDYLYLYIDGQEKAKTYIGNISVNNISGRILEIGRIDSPAGFNGLIDEVRVYNRALSPAEVRQLYNWAPNPVAHWTFDEGTGGAVADISGNNNTGTWNGTGATHWITGKYGKAGKFNGSDDHVNVTPQGTTLDTPGGITIETWLYPRNITNSSDQGIISKWSSSYCWFIEAWYSGAAWRIYFYFSDLTTVSWTPTITLAQNQWSHLTITYDKNYFRAYVNGVLIATSSNYTKDLRVSTDLAYLGYSHGSGGNAHYFNGSIDDVRIYNYARTAGQIVEDMNAGHPIGGSPIASQVGWWKFDEGYGTTANNAGYGGSTLNGTFGVGSSAPTWTNDGKYGKALSFDGSNDYISIADNNALDFDTNDFSITGWMKIPSSGLSSNNEYGFINKNSNYANSAGWGIEISTWGKSAPFPAVNIAAFNSGQTSWCNTCASKVDGIITDTWHYIAMVRTSTFIKLYIDGSLAVTNTNPQVSTSVNNAQPIIIGDHSWGPNFPGLIDEVKIYNTALTEDQIKLDYNRGASLVLGALSTGTGNTAPSTAGSQEYCIPGDTVACSPPVARWDFNEGTGTSVFDSSGYGNTGVWNGTGTHWASGKIGKAGKFNGSDDYVDLPEPLSGLPAGSTVYTVEAWFKRTGALAEATGTIISMEGVGIYNRFDLDSTNVKWYYYDGTQSVISFPYSVNNWYHAVGVRNGNSFSFYLNGNYIGSLTGDGSYPAGTNKYFIGSRLASGGSSYFFNGLIDQVRIFNYARTPAQVVWDYNRGGPVGYWKFDECQGTTAFDSSGIGNTGLISIGAGTQTSVGTCITAGTTAWYNGRNGKYNASLNFDGVDDYVDIGQPANLNVSNITVEAWVKYAAGWTGQPTIAGRDDGTKRVWSFYQQASDNLRFFVFINNTSRIKDTTFTPAVGQWYHLVGTYDGNNVRIYINGTDVGTPYGATGNMDTDTVNTLIGDDLSVSHTPFNGLIDEVRIYNYALTSTQVKSLFNQGSSIRYGPLEGNP